MSLEDTGSTTKAGIKTIAIRLDLDLHAQLSLIAQLRGATITDEIRKALEAHITAAKTAPELAAQAGTVLDDIERDALARRNAIATLFGQAQPVANEATDPSATEPAQAAATPSRSSTRGSKPTSNPAGKDS